MASVFIRWNQYDPPTGIDHYDVGRSTDGGSISVIGTVDEDGSSYYVYEDTSGSSSYYYFVRAVTTGGVTGDWAGPVSAETVASNRILVYGYLKDLEGNPLQSYKVVCQLDPVRYSSTTNDFIVMEMSETTYTDETGRFSFQLVPLDLYKRTRGLYYLFQIYDSKGVLRWKVKTADATTGASPLNITSLITALH